jgi:hypothetical protein
LLLTGQGVVVLLLDMVLGVAGIGEVYDVGDSVVTGKLVVT